MAFVRIEPSCAEELPRAAPKGELLQGGHGRLLFGQIPCWCPRRPLARVSALPRINGHGRHPRGLARGPKVSFYRDRGAQSATGRARTLADSEWAASKNSRRHVKGSRGSLVTVELAAS